MLQPPLMEKHGLKHMAVGILRRREPERKGDHAHAEAINMLRKIVHPGVSPLWPNHRRGYFPNGNTKPAESDQPPRSRPVVFRRTDAIVFG